jgi:hypothetical protein
MQEVILKEIEVDYEESRRERGVFGLLFVQSGC